MKVHKSSKLLNMSVFILLGTLVNCIENVILNDFSLEKNFLIFLINTLIKNNHVS